MIENILKAQVEKKIEAFSDENEITIEINFVLKKAIISDSKKKSESPINSMEQSVCKNIAKSKLGIDSVDGIRLLYKRAEKQYTGIAYYQKNNEKISTPFNF